MHVVQKIKPFKSALPLPGLRERKRAETYARIQAEALRLFFERGFDATTVDEIADAANVSRRSLFDYFASKEEIVFSTKAEFPDLLAAAVARRPAGEPLLKMVENALTSLAHRLQSPEAHALACLIADTPALSAGDQAKYDLTERVLAKALGDRKGLPATDLACRVTASTAIGIMKLTIEAWRSGEGPKPEVYGKAAFAALRRIAR